MPQLLIRNLAPETVVRLKARARANGRSLESELRLILEAAANGRGSDARARVPEPVITDMPSEDPLPPELLPEAHELLPSDDYLGDPLPPPRKPQVRKSRKPEPGPEAQERLAAFPTEDAAYLRKRFTQEFGTEPDDDDVLETLELPNETIEEKYQAWSTLYALVTHVLEHEPQLVFGVQDEGGVG